MRARALVLLSLVVTTAACALAGSDPGCRNDSECDSGLSCRAGACLRLTTPSSTPTDDRDAGDAGDAPSD